MAKKTVDLSEAEAMFKKFFGDSEKLFTVGEAVEHILKNKGCPPDVVKGVCAEMRSKSELRMNEFWDRNYEHGMRRALLVAINSTAIDYLDDNFPDAWFLKSFCSCDECMGKQHKGFE